MAIGAQRLNELGQPEVQALEVVGATLGGLDMDVTVRVGPSRP